MKHKLLLALALLSPSFVGTLGSSVLRADTTVQVDSIKPIDEGMRVYCQIHGTPNTSSRIDAVKINGVADAIDIDPIEFKRAFQWEEDGVIALEIDFPVKPAKKFTLKFFTSKGPITASYPAK